jgi:sugar phosphate isomerase/epimerase
MHICLNRVTAGGGLPLDQFLDIAAAAGFPGADVDLGYGQAKGAGALGDLYAARKLKLGGWGLPFDWRGDLAKQKEGLDRLAAQAKIAAQLKADSCATWLMPSSDLPLMENWLFHVQRLKPVAAVLEENGLRLGLEFIGPHHHRRRGKHEFLFTPGQMLELAAAIGPNVGLLVDVFHLYTSGSTFDHLAQIPASKIVLAHLNDAPPGSVTSLQDSKRLLPGEGVIDLNAFMDALEKAGYTGPVSLEVFSDELKKLKPADAANRAGDACRKVLPKYMA